MNKELNKKMYKIAEDLYQTSEDRRIFFLMGSNFMNDELTNILELDNDKNQTYKNDSTIITIPEYIDKDKLLIS